MTFLYGPAGLDMSARPASAHVMPWIFPGRHLPMNDLLFLGLGIALFALGGLYVAAGAKV